MSRRSLSPRLYDVVQFLAGAPLLRRRLRRLVSTLTAGEVADLGGGSGWSRRLLRPSSGGQTADDDRSFTLVELEPARAAAFRRREPGARAICADARQVPLASASVDTIFFFLVAHHLDDRSLARVLAESRRILRPGGTLVFCDPLWSPWWPTGRLLWWRDRGEFPRTSNALLRRLEPEFTRVQFEIFTFLHRYLLAVASPRAAAGSNAGEPIKKSARRPNRDESRAPLE